MPKYSAADLDLAVRAVKSSELSYNKAAILHNIPEATLRLKVKQNCSEIKKRGVNPILTPEEESDIREWMITCADRGKLAKSLITSLI